MEKRHNICYSVPMSGPLHIMVHVLLFFSLFLEVFMLLTFLGNSGKRSRKKEGRLDPKRWPSVSITVPCFNEAKTLARTVDSLLALDYPKERLSLLLIDDGSTDDTWRVMQTWKDHPQVRLHHKENGGKWTALNWGIVHTDADILGCLDADSRVAPYALKESVREFHHDETLMAVIPALQVDNPRTIMQWMQKAEYTMGNFLRVVWTALGAHTVTPGPFSLFRREVFRRIGLYREAHQTEDHEIALRMQLHHMKIGMARGAHVFTTTPSTLAKLYRQRVRWVYGFLRNLMDYRFMLFRREYGYVGNFVLPSGLLAVGAAMYFMLLFLLTLGEKAAEYTERLWVMGFPSPAVWSFEWFYITTDTILFLTAVIVVLTTGIILLSKHMLGLSMTFSRDIPLYLFLYGFLAPWWFLRATTRALLSQTPSWQAERSHKRQ